MWRRWRAWRSVPSLTLEEEGHKMEIFRDAQRDPCVIEMLCRELNDE